MKVSFGAGKGVFPRIPGFTLENLYFCGILSCRFPKDDRECLYNTECEMKMKEINGTKSRCILEKEKPIDDKCIVCGKKAKHLVVWGIQY